MIHVFILMCFYLLMGVFGAEVKSVMEGDSVILHTDITELQTKDEIEWRFKEIRIARIKRSVDINPIYEYENNERFRDRLEMNNQTGDLTITNIRSEHSGDYKLFNADKAVKSFSLTAYASLPIPVITSVKSHSSSSKCVLLCSVLNVRDVSLSWYKGNSLLSSISVSDLNIRLSLPLEVEYQDTNTYSGVVSNPISNRTQHFCAADYCQLCSHHLYPDWLRWAFTVLLRVVFIVLSLIVCYEIKSRDEQRRKSATSDE
ncbi:uncharacterized protein [Paramisgurnus dabryanus]|uniref:uncharacterized protein n=1 Tax=Paramisgurnus dabryanus TaxID=90735 RepID=UPI0031F3C63C